MINSKLISIVRPYKWKLLLIIFVNLVSILFSILTMMLIEPLVKLIFQGELNGLSAIGAKLMQFVALFADLENPRNSLTAIIIFVVMLFLLKNFFLILTQWLLAPVRSDIIRTLRNRMYRKVLLLPLSYFSGQKKGDVISRAVNDTQEVEFTVLSAFQMMISALLTVLIYVAALFTISYQLTIFVMGLLPVAGLFISLISRSLRKKNREMKIQQGLLFSHVEETIAGLRIIKGFNAQSHADSLFEKHNGEVASLQRKVTRQGDLASPMSEFLGVTVVMCILVFGGSLVLSGSSSLTAAMFITYIALFAMIVNPAKNIGTALANYHRGMAVLDRIYEVLDADEVIENASDAVQISHFEQELTMEHVSFAYATTEVLHDVSLTVKKGQMVAIVGASGAGKSTLSDLLPRFYDVTGGRILIDGVDIRQCEMDSLRSQFSIVTQDVVLFNDTIARNIAFGREQVDEQAVMAAARTANAADFIEAMPDGLNTVIGDRGLSLSGGQR